MNSDKYWTNREVVLRERLLEESITDTEKEIAKLYLHVADRLAIELEKYYRDITSNPDVLNSHRFSFNKYYELVKTIQKELKALGIKEEKILNHRLKKLYLENQKLLDKQFPLSSTPDKVAINNVINSYWVGDGLNWSARIWKNKSILQATLERGLFDVVATGRKPDDVVTMVMDKCHQSYQNASRLVRTELCHILIQSTLDKYKSAGLEQYRFLTARDERTCEVCGELDNKVFNIEDGVYGKNLPPVHPNCRCTILGVININQEIKK